jgi:hypothetical protein
VLGAVATALVVACGNADETAATHASSTNTPSTSSAVEGSDADASGQRFPDVVDVDVIAEGSGLYTFAVTISSPYDSPERYSDAWRVLAPDGTELGIRELTHDHADEQPFTRTLEGLAVPADVDTVTVEARDLVNGWGGESLEVPIPR